MKSKIIGIIPTILERRNSLVISIEKNLFNFVNKIFKNYKVVILEKCEKKKLNLIVSSGGNTIFKIDKNKANKFRAKLDRYYLSKAIKNKIPFLGICHGAQFLAFYFNSSLKKNSGHVGNYHKISYNNKKIVVNSFHNYSVIALGKKLKPLAFANDGSIEAFVHKKKRVLGIMWHPERYKNFKNFDKKFIKKNL